MLVGIGVAGGNPVRVTEIAWYAANTLPEDCRAIHALPHPLHRVCASLNGVLVAAGIEDVDASVDTWRIVAIKFVGEQEPRVARG